jgi:hypothetical protein
VQAVIDAAAWRSHEASKMALSAGWTAAVLARVKKIPKLSDFLGEGRRRRQRQGPSVQRALLLDIAASLGMKVERHEEPVL